MADNFNICEATTRDAYARSPEGSSAAGWSPLAVGVDAIVLTPPAGFTVMTEGLRIAFEAAGANTGPVTIDMDGTAYPAVHLGGEALVAGDIPAAGAVVEGFFSLDHAHFHVQLIRQPSTTTPLANSGAGAVGTSTRFSRGDHVHPAGVYVESLETGIMATGINTIPFDNSIPQIGEGDLYMTYIYTPKRIGATIIVDVLGYLASNAGQQMCIAIFKDGAANAVAVGSETLSAANVAQTIEARYKFVSVSLNDITFTVRAGGNNAGTTTFNGVNGIQAFGGAMSSGIFITEQ